jgi:aspartyl aminopeptidase
MDELTCWGNREAFRYHAADSHKLQEALMENSAEQRIHAQNLLDFIDASPSPWHAGATLASRLDAAGFSPLDERDAWSLQAGGQHYVIRGASSLIAFRLGRSNPAAAGFRIIGAHTDSPGLRLKPKGAHSGDGLIRLGVEVYGGPILATFTDRDLGLAGRLCLRSPAGIDTRLIRFDTPMARLPNLAIHMNRKVNEDGLKLNKQTELPLILGNLPAGTPSASDALLQLLAARAGCQTEDIISFELNVHDTQPGAFWGINGEFIADSQIDNLSSCHAGLTALLAAQPGASTTVCAFFDHEEIGSESSKGADGSFLADVLERISVSLAEQREDYRRALARSQLISADAAHAFHPNFPGAYEPLHGIRVNGGPAVKVNVNQRYATDGPGEARFIQLCRDAGVPCQTYVHRTDLGCGSTIGPMTAARLGIPTIDCGVPMWAMHSARESAGVDDQLAFTRVLKLFLEGG